MTDERAAEIERLMIDRLRYAIRRPDTDETPLSDSEVVLLVMETMSPVPLSSYPESPQP